MTTVELETDFARRARRSLATAGYAARVVVGDGRAGWGDAAPYDRVIVTASAGEVYRPWLDQLVDGGLVEMPLSLSTGISYQVVATFERRGELLTSTTAMNGFFMPLRAQCRARAQKGLTSGTGHRARRALSACPSVARAAACSPRSRAPASSGCRVRAGGGRWPLCWGRLGPSPGSAPGLAASLGTSCSGGGAPVLLRCGRPLGRRRCHRGWRKRRHGYPRGWWRRAYPVLRRRKCAPAPSPLLGRVGPAPVPGP